MTFPNSTELTLSACRNIVAAKPEFREIDKGRYIVFDYSVSLETTFDCSVSREMRGIAFCPETGRIVSRPFHKFFNLNERDDTKIESLHFDVPHTIMEKLDGSMIRPIAVPGGYVWGTRAGETDVAAKAVDFLDNHEHSAEYDRMVRTLLANDLTPIFEFCSRAQRIVIDYPEPKLVLTAIRCNKTGVYSPYDVLMSMNYSVIPVVDIRPQTTTGDFATFHRNIAELKDSEGVVIRFDTGKMVKMKAEDYVLKHKALDGLRFEKDVIKMHLEGLLDDVYQILSDDMTARIKTHVASFDESLVKAEKHIESVYNNKSHIENQKDFAESIKDEPFKSFMFSMRSKQAKPMDLLIAAALKATSSQAKMSEFKVMIGHERNYYE